MEIVCLFFFKKEGWFLIVVKFFFHNLRPVVSFFSSFDSLLEWSPKIPWDFSDDISSLMPVHTLETVSDIISVSWKSLQYTSSLYLKHRGRARSFIYMYIWEDKKEHKQTRCFFFYLTRAFALFAREFRYSIIKIRIRILYLLNIGWIILFLLAYFISTNCLFCHLIKKH